MIKIDLNTCKNEIIKDLVKVDLRGGDLNRNNEKALDNQNENMQKENQKNSYVLENYYIILH